MLKGLRVSIYRPADLPDGSNGGVTAQHNKATLVGSDVVGPWEPMPDELPTLYLIRDTVRIGRHEIFRTYACPDPRGAKAASWYMFGGNFIYSSDSRFPSDQPIKVFDRIEPGRPRQAEL